MYYVWASEPAICQASDIVFTSELDLSLQAGLSATLLSQCNRIDVSVAIWEDSQCMGCFCWRCSAVDSLSKHTYCNGPPMRFSTLSAHAGALTCKYRCTCLPAIL